jgi:hypothetical protein
MDESKTISDFTLVNSQETKKNKKVISETTTLNRISLSNRYFYRILGKTSSTRMACQAHHHIRGFETLRSAY